MALKFCTKVAFCGTFFSAIKQLPKRKRSRVPAGLWINSQSVPAKTSWEFNHKTAGISYIFSWEAITLTSFFPFTRKTFLLIDICCVVLMCAHIGTTFIWAVILPQAKTNFFHRLLKSWYTLPPKFF